MDYSGLVPQIAAALHVAPSSLVMLIGVIYLAAKATSRLIPDTATGWQGNVRDIAGVISVDISSRIAPGITIASAAKAAAAFVPAPKKTLVEEAADEAAHDDAQLPLVLTRSDIIKSASAPEIAPPFPKATENVP